MIKADNFVSKTGEHEVSAPVLCELHYMPSLEYFASIFKAEEVIVDVHENYVKQSYRNRCYILTANNVVALTVPVKKGNKKTIFKDILVDYEQKWVNTHWRTLQSAYGKSPFFEFYAPFFEKILFKKHKFLLDLNLDILSLCLKLLRIEKRISLTKEYQKGPFDNLQDIRGIIHPKNVNNKHAFYKEFEYNQIFGVNFVSNLSIVDLLFCEGGNAKQILQNSTLY